MQTTKPPRLFSDELMLLAKKEGEAIASKIPEDLPGGIIVIGYNAGDDRCSFVIAGRFCVHELMDIFSEVLNRIIKYHASEGGCK